MLFAKCRIIAFLLLLYDLHKYEHAKKLEESDVSDINCGMFRYSNTLQTVSNILRQYHYCKSVMQSAWSKVDKHADKNELQQNTNGTLSR